MAMGDASWPGIVWKVDPAPESSKLPKEQSLEFDGLRVEIHADVTASDADRSVDAAELRSGPKTLEFWTDAAGVVLLEWQVQLAAGGSWEVPPPAWPPGSGVNGRSLQSMMVASSSRPGQEIAVDVGSWHALRWQLLCFGSPGPPLRRVPEEMSEVVVGKAPLPPTPSGLQAGAGSLARWAEDNEDSDSDARGGAALLRLRLGGADGLVRNIVLPSATFESLAAEVAHAFQQEGVVLGRSTGEYEAVGICSGLSMRLDSDGAVGVFLSAAAGSQLG
ncbi:unnamed protein product, partial [Polarella glacialis]